MKVSALPPGAAHRRSAGDTRIQLALSKVGPTLVPLLHFTDTAGHHHVIELQPQECADLAVDLMAYCQADPAQRETWQLELMYQEKPKVKGLILGSDRPR